MGEDPGFDVDALDDDTNYHVFVDNFYTIDGAKDCSDDFQFVADCWRLGSAIKDFVKNGKECDRRYRICTVSPPCSQKITDITNGV